MTPTTTDAAYYTAGGANPHRKLRTTHNQLREFVVDTGATFNAITSEEPLVNKRPSTRMVAGFKGPAVKMKTDG